MAKPAKKKSQSRKDSSNNCKNENDRKIREALTEKDSQTCPKG